MTLIYVLCYDFSSVICISASASTAEVYSKGLTEILTCFEACTLGGVCLWATLTYISSSPTT